MFLYTLNANISTRVIQYTMGLLHGGHVLISILRTCASVSNYVAMEIGTSTFTWFSVLSIMGSKKMSIL